MKQRHQCHRHYNRRVARDSTCSACRIGYGAQGRAAFLLAGIYLEELIGRILIAAVVVACSPVEPSHRKAASERSSVAGLLQADFGEVQTAHVHPTTNHGG